MRLEYVKYGSLGGSWVGTGIALQPTLPATHRPHHPGYTPPPPCMASRRVAAPWHQSYMAVGLISVGQLTLDGHISGFGTMTEVYNLIKIGRINNHSFIPQTK